MFRPQYFLLQMKGSTMFKLIEKSRLWFLLSFAVISLGLVTMGLSALKHQSYLKFGIDFTGGSSLMFKLQDVTTSDLSIIESTRAALSSFNLEGSQIQITKESELIIKTVELSNEQRLAVVSELTKRLGSLELLEVDIIGPTIGAELKQKSLWIILAVSLLLLLYISMRFEWRYGLSALVAVLHDALIIISMAALFDIEINTAFVAALLTVLGYSINDTIVIFDRIREWLAKDEVFRNLDEALNSAVTSMFARSMHTSLTTLAVIGSLFVFGGTTIKTFCLVLLIGIISGTYSSLFIATPVLAVLFKRESHD